MKKSSRLFMALLAALLLAAPLAPLSSSKSTNPCSACHGSNTMYLDILEGDPGNTLPTVLNDGESLTVAVVIEVTGNTQKNNVMSSITATLASQNGFFSVAVPVYNIGSLSDGHTATASWKISPLATGNDVMIITAQGVNTHNNRQFSDSYSPSPSIAVNKAVVDLPPTIALTAPASSTTITGGTDVAVSWVVTDEDMATCVVNLYYTTDDFTTVNQTIATAIPAAQGYTWKTPLIDSTSVRLKATVTDKKGNFNATLQGGHFAIDSLAPSVLSVLPADKATNVSDSAMMQVNFSEPVVVSTAQLAFGISPDPGGVSWSWNAEKTTMTGSHDPFAAGTTYTCTVSAGVKDLSSPGNVLQGSYSWSFATPGAIVPVPSMSLTSPAGGERFYWGDKVSIRWSASGGTGTLAINLSISQNGTAGPFTPIASDIANSGLYTFTVPQLVSDTCLIQGTVHDDNGKESRSAGGPFSVAQDLSLAADLPPPGATFHPGNSTLINWTSAGGHGAVVVNISFLQDSNSAVQTIFSNLPRSGSRNWTAPEVNTDSARIFINATDDWGRSFEVSSEPFTILANRAPRFVSKAHVAGEAQVPYLYLAKAVDDDGDGLTFSLLIGQPGMALDSSSGRISWTPAAAGNFSVALKVSDGKGGEAVQEFTVNVAAGKVKPGVNLITPSEGQKIKGKFNITGAATKGTLDIAKVQLRVDTGDWMDVSGTAGWKITLDTTKLKNGNHTLQVRAFDGTDYSETVNRTVNVDNWKPAGRNIMPMLDGWMMLALLATAVVVSVLRRRY